MGIHRHCEMVLRHIDRQASLPHDLHMLGPLVKQRYVVTSAREIRRAVQLPLAPVPTTAIFILAVS